MKKFFERKFILFNLIFDALSLLYVLFFKIQPERVILFYWLDSCVMIFFFMVFLKSIGRLTWYIEILPGTFILLCLNFGGLLLFLTLAKLTGYDERIGPEEFKLIFWPYFDIAPLILASSIANFYFFEKLKTLFKQGINSEFVLYYNVVYSIFLIPIVIMFSYLLNLVIDNRILSIILCFIIFRNRLDNWRHKSINALEKELNEINSEKHK